MSTMDAYEISEEIKALEYDDNRSILSKISKLLDLARSNEEAYIGAYTLLIEMEEAANSKQITAYDIPNARLKLISRAEQTFRISLDVSS